MKESSAASEAEKLEKCTAVLAMWHATPGNRRDAKWWQVERELREQAFVALGFEHDNDG